MHVNTLLFEACIPEGLDADLVVESEFCLEEEVVEVLEVVDCWLSLRGRINPFENSAQ